MDTLVSAEEAREMERAARHGAAVMRDHMRATGDEDRAEEYRTHAEDLDGAAMLARTVAAGVAVTRAEQRAAKLQREAEAWNVKHPVGTRVRYWRGLREGAPSGEGAVRYAAQVVCGTASVWVEGCTGCVALSHVEEVSR